MSVTYIIGSNLDLPGGEQTLKVNVNTTTEYFLSTLLEGALKENYPYLYERITEQVIFICFDDLCRDDFLTVIMAINDFINSNDLTADQKIGGRWWKELIEPLIQIDQRVLA